MAIVQSFTFNAFQENTYIVYDDTKECVIIDPGCYSAGERKQLTQFITSEQLTPVRLLNTHCHIDHVFSNNFIHETYGLLPECHEQELTVLQLLMQVADMYGIPTEMSPMPERYIADNELVQFGNTTFQALFTPGHSPGSLSFYCAADKFVIAGDVLFYGSIGRTDLPGGDYDTLIGSINRQLLPLGDNVFVYCGHGPTTTIGHEKLHNPILT